MKLERIIVTGGVGAACLLALGLGSSGTVAQPAPASPLASYPGFGHNPAADEARFRREDAARQRRIARCMTEKGFDYQPPADETNPARERGSAQAQAKRSSGADAAAALPADRRVAYYLALYGVEDPNDPQRLWNPTSETGGGCWGDALRTFPGVFAARSALAEELAQMRMAVFEDSEVRAADARWGQCMTGKGHKATSVHDVVAEGGPPSGAVTAAVGQCRVSSGLDAAVARAALQKEAEFVTRHKARLDALKARIDAQPALD